MTDQTLTQSKLDLRQHLLANFCDGDSWEAADALSLTKHGALDVAKYFFLLGVEMAEGCVPEKQTESGHIDITEAIARGMNACRDQTLAAIKELKEELKEELGKESV